MSKIHDTINAVLNSLENYLSESTVNEMPLERLNQYFDIYALDENHPLKSSAHNLPNWFAYEAAAKHFKCFRDLWSEAGGVSFDSYAKATQAAYLTRLRAAAKDRASAALKFFVSKFVLLSKSDYDNLRNKQTARLSKNLNKVFTLDIDRAAASLDRAKALLKEKSHFKKILAFCLFSGRRTTEISSTAHFEEIKGVDNQVLFYGQLKKRGETSAAGFPIYIIGITAKEFIKEFNEFRQSSYGQMYASLTPYEVEKKISFSLSRYAAKAFKFKGYARKRQSGEIVNSFKPHDLRRLYAAISFYLYGGDQDRNIFISRIMGHNKSDHTTAQNYKNILVK